MSEKMIFCLGDGKWESKGEGYQKHLRIFNQDVTEEEYARVRSLLNDNEIKIKLTSWVDKKDMTKEGKENKPIYKEIGGYLKTFTYEEAWANFWNKASIEQKNVILTLPQFNAEIFKEITGIEANKTNLSGKEVSVTLDGVTYTAVIK